MCGIAGLARAAGGSFRDSGAVLAALSHRGPDGSDVFQDDHVQLCHTRLAIIDPSPAGAQPMMSKDGRYVLIFNGELYNFAGIRAALAAEGSVFRGSSDTEVLLALLARRGAEALSQLVGIFAFAFYDRETRDLLLARDPLGVKPLYWSTTSAGCAFASEIKALLALAPLTRAVDALSLQKYLTFLWCPGDGTMLRGVRKLEPGTAMIVRAGAIARRWRYWEAPTYLPRRDWTRETCRVALQEAVTSAVDRQMVADVPVGALLSGGLDSTAVVAAARRSNPHIHCFTMRMAGTARSDMDDDLVYARLAAKTFGLPLTEVEISPAQIVSHIGDAIVALDEPLADPAAISLFLMAQEARKHGIKVLLSGTGGDDLFSGYRRHLAARTNGWWDLAPLAVRRVVAAGARQSHGGSDVARRVAKALSSLDQPRDRRLARLFAWADPAVVNQVLHPDLRQSDADVYADLEREITDDPAAPDLEKCLRLDRRFFLSDHNLVYTDKMGMAAGVEIRVPLLDQDVVALASRIPSEWKQRGFRSKWLFKQSQRGLIPDAIIDRPKRGFGVPLRQWLKHDMRALKNDLLSPASLASRGLFDARAVQRLCDANDTGQMDVSYLLFAIMCVEAWCRGFLDRSIVENQMISSAG